MKESIKGEKYQWEYFDLVLTYQIANWENRKYRKYNGVNNTINKERFDRVVMSIECIPKTETNCHWEVENAIDGC